MEVDSQGSKGSVSNSCNDNKDEELKEEDLKYLSNSEMIPADDENDDYQLAPLGQIVEERNRPDDKNNQEMKWSRSPERQEVEIARQIPISS